LTETFDIWLVAAALAAHFAAMGGPNLEVFKVLLLICMAWLTVLS
jgi:hypothetical protein